MRAKINNDGVSNVIASIMILAIMMSLLGMIFVTYVPAWGESIQYAHMNTVGKEFIDLKNHLDVMVVRGDVDVSMSSSLTLGDEGGPVLGVGSNTGDVAFSQDTPTMDIFNTSSSESYAKGRGGLGYFSNNDRISNKNYYFEHDAIIVSQDTHDYMKAKPNIFLSNSSGQITVSYAAISFTGESRSLSGTKTIIMTTTLISSQTMEYYHGSRNGIQNVTFSLTTDHVEVWNLYFKDLFNASGLKSQDFKIVKGTNFIHVDIYNVYRLVATSAVIDIKFTD
jgi:hypothetical protein